MISGSRDVLPRLAALSLRHRFFACTSFTGHVSGVHATCCRHLSLQPTMNPRDGLTKNSRRRSLKTLFQVPIPGRSCEHGPVSATEAVGSIPADVVREIVDLLSPADILSFSLTVRHRCAFVISCALADAVWLPHFSRSTFDRCSCRPFTTRLSSSRASTVVPLSGCSRTRRIDTYANSSGSWLCGPITISHGPDRTSFSTKDGLCG